MPNYEFESQDGQEYTTLFYHFSAAPKIGEVIIDENGKQWKRIASALNANTDSKIDPFSEKDFLKKTNKRGKMKDLWNRSKELSEKRKDKNGGVDPIAEKFYSDYESKFKHKHPEKKKQECKKNLEKLGVTLE
jgi:hypothetical protein